MNEQAVDAKVAALVTKVGVESKDDVLITGWLVKTMIAGADFPGFVSAEILPPESSQAPEWMLVQRFRKDVQVDAWKKSPAQSGLMTELKTAYSENALRVSQEEHADYGTRGSVTTAIVTHVNPHMDAAYRKWEGQVQTAQAKFPGYRGSYFQPP